MAAALALGLLVLLPGALVVRAPWTAVPALSLAFWALSSAWLPARASRASVVSALLLVSGLLAALRLLPRHELAPPPGWPVPPAPTPPARAGRTPPPLACAASLLVAAVALALLLPAPLWHNPPGPALAFQTTSARLLLWRDGVPFSAEPLLPLAPFGAHAPALASLSADLSRLAGLEPARAVVLVVLAAASLTLVGLYGLLATRRPPVEAALAALLALGAVPWPAWIEAWGAGAALLALALVLPGAALLVGHASRSSGFAAGLLLGGGALAQPLLAAAAVAGGAGVVLWQPPRGRPAAWRRLALVLVTAALVAAPGLVPLARALSAREAVAIAASVTPAEWLASALALLLLGLASALARLAGARRPLWRGIGWAAALASGALFVARVHGWMASGELPAATRAALARVAVATGPLEAVCAEAGVRDWLPAVSGRAPGEPPWIPGVYAEEWSRRLPRACTVRLTTRGDIVSRPAGKPPNGSSVLIDRRGSVTLPTR
ncbi:MAG: hypothetical protein ACM3PV_16030 [Betaproteobacteria bacterium]